MVAIERRRLAEAYGRVGQAEEGLRVLAEALTAVRERSLESELYRLKGELILQQFQVPSFQFHPILSPSSLALLQRQKPKRVFSRSSRLPASNRRSRWSCGR